jgi:protein-tyrosine phosphatase
MTRILVVCSANVCRSRLAASVLSDELPASLASVRSAGTKVSAGAHVCHKVVDVAAESFHADRNRMSRAGANEVTPNGLRMAQLVLVADRSLRSQLARLVPECRTIMFTLLEAERLSEAARALGELTETTERARLLEFVRRMDSLRGRVPITSKRSSRHPLEVNRRAYDIQDGHNRSPLRHRRTLNDVVRSSRAISRNILLAVSPNDAPKGAQPETPSATGEY